MNVQAQSNPVTDVLGGLPPEVRLQVLEDQLKQLADAQSDIRFRHSAMEFAVRCAHVEVSEVVGLAAQIEKYLKGAPK